MRAARSRARGVDGQGVDLAVVDGSLQPGSQQPEAMLLDQVAPRAVAEHGGAVDEHDALEVAAGAGIEERLKAVRSWSHAPAASSSGWESCWVMSCRARSLATACMTALNRSALSRKWWYSAPRVTRARATISSVPLFLDFLEGKADFACTAWGMPSYSVFGWQRPCYLMSDGYASTYKELVETTDWTKYGRGRDPRCANCMAHCGYEPTAVLATMGSLKESLRALSSA